MPYAALSALWIFLSDNLISHWFDTPAQIVAASTLKGWAFVAVTTVLLVVLVRRYATWLMERDAAIREVQSEKLRVLHLLEAIADSSPDAVTAKDNDGRYVLFNKGAAVITGKKADEVIGLTDREIFPPEVCERFLAGDARALATDSVITSEETMTGPQGVLTLLVTKGPLRDEAGGLQGVFGIARDITERKAMERALRDSQQRYRSLFDNMLDGIAYCQMTHDEAGQPDFVYLEVNPKFEELTTLRNVVGKSVREVIPGIERSNPELFEIYGRVAAGGRPERFQTLLAPLGIWLEISAFSLEPGYFVAVFENVTEYKHYEERLLKLNEELETRVAERTRQLQLAINELESFSYSVSHDLRAPLRAINGYSRLLFDLEHQHLDENARQMLDRIAHNANRLGELIDDILEYSRAGRMPLEREVVDLDALVRSLCSELGATYNRTVFDIAALPQVEGSPTMLRMIFQNLIENACKYSADRATPHVRIGTQAESGKTIFFVGDNGVGFDMHYAGKLFGMFQRMHSDKQFPGTGVGLSIVKRLVERHEGHVWAEAEIDKGATFFLTLGPDESATAR